MDVFSERIQRRVLWLLAEADTAAQAGHWIRVQNFITDILGLYSDNNDGEESTPHSMVQCLHCGANAVERLVICTECGAEQTTERLQRESAQSVARRGNLEQQAIKLAHSNAGEPWSSEADERLAALFRGGTSTVQLMKEFGRTGGAITSRIKRLGLV